MSDQNDPEERRTEGVRIIGAQEAAEAAGRPDVVRRRRRSEKKFGDRPDRPNLDSDGPMIKISTTEPTDDPTGVLGSTPVVRPSAGDASDVIGGSGEGSSTSKFGHARIVAAADETPSEEAGPDEADDDTAWDSTPWEDLDGSPSDVDDWDIDDPDLSDDDGLGDSNGDGSFVLPHWTEPPTGQVPKVITGVEPEDETFTANVPRWRDEGERGGETDFADLADEGRRLGALDGGSDDDDDYLDDDYLEGDEPDYFDDIDDYDEVDDVDTRASDFFERDEPEFEEFDQPARRRPKQSGALDDGDGAAASSGGRNLPQAIAVGLGLVGVGLACFAIGELPTTILVMVILGISTVEAMHAAKLRGIHVPVELTLPALAGLLLSTFYFQAEAYPVVLGIIMITGLLWYLWIAPGARLVRDLGATLFIIMWIGFLGSFATLILGVGHKMKEAQGLTHNPGFGVLIAAVIVTVSHDVGAYFAGKYLGKTPLSDASPNKTMEGLAGGVVAGIFVPLVIVSFIGLAPIGPGVAQTIIFSALCSVMAPLGDLCQSRVKRDLGIKDMSGILPGHGGVLDRFDALLFVLPTAYFLTLLMDIWAATPK